LYFQFDGHTSDELKSCKWFLKIDRKTIKTEVVMKAMKSLLLVLCLLSAFSVAAYAGDGGCSCWTPFGPTSQSIWVTDIPQGVTVGYELTIQGSSENGYSQASAGVMYPLTFWVSHYAPAGVYYWGPIVQSGYFQSQGAAYIGCDVSAETLRGSGAAANVHVWW
jgi:hypothetical protein